MRRPSSDSGATTVEFALVFPLFVGIVAVGAFFGWLAYTQAQVDRAAQRAARYAAVPVTTTGTSTYEYCHDKVLAAVNEDLQASRVLPSELVVQDRTGTLPEGSACAVPRGRVRVTVSHTFSNPFSSIVALLTPVSGTWTVTGSGQSRVEA